MHLLKSNYTMDRKKQQPINTGVFRRCDTVSIIRLVNTISTFGHERRAAAITERTMTASRALIMILSPGGPRDPPNHPLISTLG